MEKTYYANSNEWYERCSGYTNIKGIKRLKAQMLLDQRRTFYNKNVYTQIKYNYKHIFT